MPRWIVLLTGLLLWSAAQAGELRVAFNLDKPPFAFRDVTGEPTGIEVDVMRTALQRMGYAMKAVGASKVRLLSTVDSCQADAAAGVLGTDSAQRYFTESIIDYANVVITRKASGLRIEKLADLDKVRFIVWQHGWSDLGPEFEARYKPDAQGRFRPNYFEASNQESQTKAFWFKRVDAIIIEPLVFDWYRRHLDATAQLRDELEYHRIFQTRTPSQAMFADPNLRDQFNAVLKAMQANGGVQRIVDQYR